VLPPIFPRVKDLGVNYLADAGPLVGAFWPADQWHGWSRETLASLGAPVYTTESVFAEAAHHLKAHVPAMMQLLAAYETGLVRFIPTQPAHAIRAAEIITRYAPRADWGDATLVILSERHPRARLITVDVRDFTVYRRRDGSPVPSIMPDSPA
jgi:predicted nucleic acid-binding protein